MTITYGVDTSLWQKKIDGKALKRGGVQFAFVKASDGKYVLPSFASQAVEYTNASIILGAYHWFQPFVDPKLQADVFLRAVDGKGVSCLAADFEQFGSDYTNKAPILAPQQLSDSLRSFLDALRSKTGTKIIIYTRATFLIPYASPVFKWINDYDLWLASYPFHPAQRITCTWEQFLSQYAQKSFAPYQGPYWPKGANGKPVGSVKFWQFTGDRFCLPGTFGDVNGTAPSPLDVNMFNGSVDDLRVYLNLQAPRELTLEEKVERLWASHPELH